MFLCDIVKYYMKKINILTNKEARFLGLYYGYWNFFFIFRKELNDLNLEINFFSRINKKFLEADYLFLNSRSFPQKNELVDIDYLKNLYSKNSNLYWFDMRDSAGTTQFEVLPYVKKYIKKQFYKDKSIYFKKIEGGRFYADYYINKYKIKDETKYHSIILKKEYIDKLLLGWNIGVGFFFDYLNFTKFDYYKEFIKIKYLKKNEFSLKINDHQDWSSDKNKHDLICLMNTKFNRNSVGFQRNKLKKILTNVTNLNKITDIRFNKNAYYKTLKNTKISIGAYGWGEVCYREFEATKLGVAIMFPNMEHIDTWPNIYINNETYTSYDLNFDNFNNKLMNLVSDIKLRKYLVNNAKDVLNDIHKKVGKDYFIKTILNIIT